MSVIRNRVPFSESSEDSGLRSFASLRMTSNYTWILVQGNGSQKLCRATEGGDLIESGKDKRLPRSLHCGAEKGAPPPVGMTNQIVEVKKVEGQRDFLGFGGRLGFERAVTTRLSSKR